jgi:hypothetical protein
VGGGRAIWGLKGFIGIGGCKKRYLVKIRVSFIRKMYLEGGSIKGFWEVFINI